MELYYYPLNASMAPHFLLNELDADYELIFVDRKSNAQKSEEYLVLNPLGRIPTFRDGALVISESVAICMYLCDKFGSQQWAPSMNHPLRAKFYQWMAYLSNTIQPELMIYFYPENFTSDHNFQKSLVQQQEIRISEMLAQVDEHLSRSAFLLGETISACDLYLLMLSIWCDELSYPPSSFAHLARYLASLAQRPAIFKTCNIEGYDLSTLVV